MTFLQLTSPSRQTVLVNPAMIQTIDSRANGCEITFTGGASREVIEDVATIQRMLP